MTLHISDTRTGEKRPFTPLDETVRIYVCGMTPKAPPHAGHGFMFVHMDVVRRYLEYRGYKVRHLQNFTDIDDKIIDRARAVGQDPLEYAEEQTRAYFDVLDRLRVRHAHEYPTVTGSMSAIVAAVQHLIDRGVAYATSQGVYFSVPDFPDYGSLSGRTDELGVEAGARVEVDPEKRDPRDFALWKLAPDDEIGWDSPWGRGRPGWHIECSTMIQTAFGNQIDIHGGGADLIFPHHENEIAQSEAGSGESPFVRHWLHTGLLQTEGEKMAHSAGNYTTLADVLEVVEPDVLRLFFLSVHYRTAMGFSMEALQPSASAYERLRSILRARGGDPSGDAETLAAASGQAQREFESAMDDDFNAPRAIGALFELGRSINRAAPSATPAAVTEAQACLRDLLGVLGIEVGEGTADAADAAPYIELLVEIRGMAREARQWELADRVRDRLADLDVVLEDGPDGTIWRRKAPTDP
ncbi:MAG: cysteine--tRNA ligase [Chloroflexi bacterium]|nr:cysteine--tRNA ligase [Chloroflexota bacterium]